MNLIANRQLDNSERQVIYELTLKKRQSKKPTMSARQVAARQQLAKELLQERIDPLDYFTYTPLKQTTPTIRTNFTDSSLFTSESLSLDRQPSTSSIGTNTSTTSALISSQQSTTGSCGFSFSRSDSSYSGSSNEDSGAQLTLIDISSMQHPELVARKKEASIKFNKTRLEHLNEQLEKRLYHYEYLVAKEKALLGAYNMLLFTPEGVNNFHQDSKMK